MKPKSFSFRGLLAVPALTVFWVASAAAQSGPIMGIDANGNGISDVYERIYGTVANPAADTDKDGPTDAQEAAAGTNFKDAHDRLGLTNLSSNGSSVTVHYASKPGKKYILQGSENLGGWVDENTGVMGDGTVQAASCPVVGTRMFMRVRVVDTDSDADGVTDWEERALGTEPTAFSTQGNDSGDMALASALLEGASMVEVGAVSNYALEAGPVAAQFKITRRGGVGPITVPLTLGGTATIGADYTASSSISVALASGDTSALVTITPVADAVAEDNESVTLTLGAGAGYTLGSLTSATITIAGQGLQGEYFNNSNGTYVALPGVDPNNFTGTGFSRFDATVDFDWAGTAPAGLVDDDLWSARWTGAIVPRYSEPYTLSAIADRGVVVYFSDKPITGATNQMRINAWSTASPTAVNSASALASNAPLVAGKPYYLRVDYRDSQGSPNNSNIQLRWSSASQPDEVIPANRLAPAISADTPVITSFLYATGVYAAPFSYQIIAKNAPTTYSAAGLPAGLSIDTATGNITGSLTAPAGFFFPSITAANANGSDTRQLVLYFLSTPGNITRDVWNALAGAGVDSVPVHTAPSSSAVLTTMEAPANTGDNFGDRMRGFITAPVTGNYTFFATSDENVDLYISASPEPANKLRRSWVVNGSVAPGAWTTVSSQTSLQMRMKAGRKYYIEAVRRETSGGDHCAIAWQRPGASGPEVIPSYALSPYSTSAGGSASTDTIYVANLIPQNGATTLGTGEAVLRVNAAKTSAILTYTFANLTGPIISQHIHDIRPLPGPVGAITYDIDDHPPTPTGERTWEFVATGQHTISDVVASIEQGAAYINLHTTLYPNGEIRGYFQPVIGSQSFSPPATAPAAELTLPTDALARKHEVVRFLQQATFGAKEDADGLAPWDADSIEAVEALGYEGWINAQLAIPPTGGDPDVLIFQDLTPRNIYPYVAPTPGVRNFQRNTLTRLHNGSGALSSIVRAHSDKWPLTGFNAGGSNQSSEDIWRAWWKNSVTCPDQLRQRIAFALSQILVLSEDGELDERTRAVVHYYDLLGYHGLGNFRTLIEKITLNPAMGMYLDMINNRKPTGTLIPNENFAREILQLFSIGLRRMHPDGTLVLNSAGVPVNTYEQNNVVGYAHTFTGWVLHNAGTGNPATGTDILPMSKDPANHDNAEKLLLEETILAGGSGNADAATMDRNLAGALDVIFHHPNVGPFISRQLIQRLVTANPSPSYIYRVTQKFNNNGSGVRGDISAVVKAILLDPEARNATPRTQPGYGHLKEPVIRATQVLRAFKPFSVGETHATTSNMIGTVTISPNDNVNLALPLTYVSYTLTPASNALFANEVVRLRGQTVTTENGYYRFTGNGALLTFLAATLPAGETNRGDWFTNVDLAVGLPVSHFTIVGELNPPQPPVNTTFPAIILSKGNSILLRNQTNPKENGVYTIVEANQPIVRATFGDAAAELNNATVHVGALWDPTLATPAFVSQSFKCGSVASVGTDDIVFTKISANISGRNMWNMGTTGGQGGDRLSQTPLRSPTVFNFYEPDYVFLGATGNTGLFSPEFQVTSETSIVNAGNWFFDLTRRNNINATTQAEPYSYGQGYTYQAADGGGTLARDVKLNLTTERALADTPAALIDRMNTLLLAGQLPARLHTLLAEYVATYPATSPNIDPNANRMTRVGEALNMISLSPEFSIQK